MNLRHTIAAATFNWLALFRWRKTVATQTLICGSKLDISRFECLPYKSKCKKKKNLCTSDEWVKIDTRYSKIGVTRGRECRHLRDVSVVLSCSLFLTGLYTRRWNEKKKKKKIYTRTRLDPISLGNARKSPERRHKRQRETDWIPKRFAIAVLRYEENLTNRIASTRWQL